MRRIAILGAAAGLLHLTVPGGAFADAVRLTNGDTLKGAVASVNAQEVKLTSDNFGELTIPRDKVHSVYFGDAEPFAPAAAPPMAANAAPAAVGQNLPSLGNAEVQGQLNSLLQNLMNDPEMRNLQQNATQAREGLQDLQKDFGPGPEADALGAYINLFNRIAPPQQQPKPKPAPTTPAPESTPKP